MVRIGTIFDLLLMVSCAVLRIVPANILDNGFPHTPCR